MSAEQFRHFDEVNHKAYTAWLEARKEKDYRFFQEALAKRIEAEKQRVSLYEPDAIFPEGLYDRMLDDYEPGLNVAVMDRLFSESIPALQDILPKAQERSAGARRDFLSIEVTDEQQRQMTEYLLDILCFDRSRGTWGMSVHPFSDGIGPKDVRLTTYFDPHSFTSNIYSVIHECGHSLFEQKQPMEDHVYHIAGNKSMGQHETVSRFYENILGRSRAFIHLIYPKVCEVFPQAMKDVSEEELYIGVNLAEPSLIRMDADEITYTFHIFIRYEMEKGMIDGSISPEEAGEAWNGFYEKYLGVVPKNDLEGILQDSHWTDSFGYFPTYALGNFYGAMILNRMREDFDPFALVEKGDFQKINAWMTEHVFQEADMLPPAAWIKMITGRELTAADYVAYLQEKYNFRK